MLHKRQKKRTGTRCELRASLPPGIHYMDDDYGEPYIDLEDDKEFSFSDTDSIDDCGNVEHKNLDVHSEEHEGADDQNEPTKHADADVAPDVYTNILELTEADI
ncbi:hypothetical protein RIF29_08731 [Crotalaria pallida]|uniref:Uncharacterized protein n=1 Tax=Crotalaria pallida TaxID=3830 RepID=A0AAN9ILK2_CROPI